MLSVQLIKRFNVKTIAGEKVVLPQKKFQRGQVIDGFIFGLGWAVMGACPGSVFAQIGSGFGIMLVTLLSAIAGTWLYGRFSHKLPH